MLCKVQEPATCSNNSAAHGHPRLRCSKGLPALHAMVQANWTVFVHDVTGRLQGLLKLALHADRWGCTGGSPREDIASCPCDKRTLRVCVPSPDSGRLPVLDKPETSCPVPCASESMLSLVRTPLDFEGTFSFESRFFDSRRHPEIPPKPGSETAATRNLRTVRLHTGLQSFLQVFERPALQCLSRYSMIPVKLSVKDCGYLPEPSQMSGSWKARAVSQDPH